MSLVVFVLVSLGVALLSFGFVAAMLSGWAYMEERNRKSKGFD